MKERRGRKRMDMLLSPLMCKAFPPCIQLTPFHGAKNMGEVSGCVRFVFNLYNVLVIFSKATNLAWYNP